MSKTLYRSILIIIWIVIVLVFIFLYCLSIEAANETDNWEFLKFDFAGKDNIISAYGGLLGSILSFITILFIILDLVYQRRQKAIEIEVAEQNRIQDLRDVLGIAQLFIKRLYKNNLKQNERMNIYVEKETEHSTEMNQLGFSPNTFPKLILDADRQNIYRAFKEFKHGKDWQESYVDLYKICDFYDVSLKELMEKHQIRLDKKYKNSQQIADDLDVLIDKVSEARNNLIIGTDDKPKLAKDPVFVILENFDSKRNEIFEKRKKAIMDGVNPDEMQAEMMEYREKIVGPIFSEILNYYNTIGNMPSYFEEILKLSQRFLRQSQKLIKDSRDYANHLKNYNTQYLARKSSYQKRLLEIYQDLKSIR